MKTIRILNGLFVALGLCGCVSSRTQLVMDRVGPAPLGGQGVGHQGSLVVFSALDPTPGFSAYLYRNYYTDYRILTNDGSQVVKQVRNNSGKLANAPSQLDLPMGNYQIIARANGYGLVIVPVVIRPGQVTTVHLEGSTWWPASSAIHQSNPVRLPHGQIVGWRARSETSFNAVPNAAGFVAGRALPKSWEFCLRPSDHRG